MLEKIKAYFRSFYDFEGASGWEKNVFNISLVILVLSFIPRFWGIDKFLPVYSIDENELVEFAVSYFGGDKEPHWYRYGTSYSYLLHYFYKIQLVFSSLNEKEFIQSVFVEPGGLYYSARFLNGVLNIILAFLVFEIGKLFFNRKVALVAFALALFPFTDILVAFTIRVDTLLAVFVLSSLYYIGKLIEEPRKKYYLLLGLFWGLSLGTKPIPALLIGPTMLFAVLHAYFKHNSTEKIDANYILGAFTDPKVYMILGGAFIGNFIGNPYSILNWSEFYAETIKLLQEEGARSFMPGWNLMRFFDSMGYFFTILGFGALLHFIFWPVKRKEWRTLVLVSYPVVFFAAFAPGAARTYFYVPFIPILTLLIAALLYDLVIKNEKFKFPAFPIIIAAVVLLFAQPVLWVMEKQIAPAAIDNQKEYTILASKDWMEQSIQKNESILFAGFYVNQPRVVLGEVNNYGPFGGKMKASMWGEYFMYGRWNKENFRQDFQEWHNEYIQSGKPRFDKAVYYKSVDAEKVLQLAIQQKANYLSIASPLDLDTNQFFKDLEVKRFEKGIDGMEEGPDISIYQIDLKNLDKMVCKNPRTWLDFYNNAIIYNALRKTNEAQEMLSAVLEKNPKNKSAVNLKAQLFAQAGNNEEAKVYYQKVLDIDNEDLNAINGLAQAYFNNKEYKESIKAYNKLMELKADYGNAYVMAAQGFIQLKDQEKALQTIENGIVQSPNTADLYLLKANIFEQQGNQKLAAANYREAYKRAPNNMNAIQRAFNLDSQLKDFNSMLKDINAYIKVQPKNGQLYTTRGQIYQQLNNKQKACEDFNKAAGEFGDQQAAQIAASYCR